MMIWSALILLLLTSIYLYWKQKRESQQNQRRQKETLTRLQRLELENEHLRTVFNASQDAIFVLALDGANTPVRFVEVNDVACSRLEYSRKELLALPPVEIIPEELRGHPQTYVQRYFTAGRALFERQHLTRTGRRIAVEISAHLFAMHGQQHVVAIARDISERQVARRQLQLLSRAIDSSFSGFMITEVRDPDKDEDHPIIYVNPAFEQLTGYSSSEALECSPRFLLGTDHRQKSLKTVERAIKSGRECRVVLRNYRKNGEMFWNMLQVSPVRNEMGQVTHHITTFEEVTHRRQMHRQRIRAALQLQKLSIHLQNAREDERARIARELHDELGQTLTAVKMDIAFLRRQALSSIGLAKLDDMGELIDATLMAIRRISADLRPVILDDLGLKAAVEWLVQDFRKRNPQIHCQLALELQEAQIGDALAIASFRIVQECLTNVARHAQATKVHVLMSVRRGSELVICIQDNGCGLPAAAAARRDGHLRSTDCQRGFGMLGMRERVAALSGRYVLESLPGEGLTVDIVLPLQEPEII